jgi:hypothetical protein
MLLAITRMLTTLSPQAVTRDMYCSHASLWEDSSGVVADECQMQAKGGGGVLQAASGPCLLAQSLFVEDVEHGRMLCTYIHAC